MQSQAGQVPLEDSLEWTRHLFLAQGWRVHAGIIFRSSTLHRITYTIMKATAHSLTTFTIRIVTIDVNGKRAARVRLQGDARAKRWCILNAQFLASDGSERWWESEQDEQKILKWVRAAYPQKIITSALEPLDARKAAISRGASR